MDFSYFQTFSDTCWPIGLSVLAHESAHPKGGG
jgi:hypothetical protein